MHHLFRRALSALALIVALATVTAAAASAASIRDDESAVWDVTTTIAGGATAPNASASTVAIGIRNRSSHTQTLRSVALSVASSDGNVVDDATGRPVLGCLAQWFTARTTPTGTTAVAPSQTTRLMASVSMVESHTNQDACQGVHIRLSVSAS